MALTVAMVLSLSIAGCSAATSGTGGAPSSAAEAPLPEPVPAPPQAETPPETETPGPSQPTDGDTPPAAAPPTPPPSTGVPSDTPGRPTGPRRFCKALYYDDPHKRPPTPYSASTPAPAEHSPPLVLRLGETNDGKPQKRHQVWVAWPGATSTTWPVETYELAWTRAGDPFPAPTIMQVYQVGQSRIITTNYAITGLQAGTEYKVRVRPRYEGADYEADVRVSAWSPVFTVRTMDPLPLLDCTEGQLVLDSPWFTLSTRPDGSQHAECDERHPAFKTYRDLAPWSARSSCGSVRLWSEPRIWPASLRVRIAGRGDVQVDPDSTHGQRRLTVLGLSVTVGGRSCELTDVLYLTIDGLATFDTTCAE